MDNTTGFQNESPVIEINGLTLRFGRQSVLENFSLTVGQGQKVLISGRSGSGKSSLLRSLLGFVVPQQGELKIEGTVLDGKTIWHLRRRIGYVAQESQLGDGVVRDLLMRPFSWKANHALKYNAELAMQLCRQFYISENPLDKKVGDLSGGEKQRVALIMALLLQRPIYLLDEATSALDAESKKAVVDYLAARKDLTLLMVSHDMTQSSIADRVVSLSNTPKGGT